MISLAANLSNPAGAIFLSACLFAASAGLPSEASENTNTATTLLGNATATLENGRSYTGTFVGIDDGRLRVRLFEGTGQIEYSPRIEEIASVRFPGDEVERAAMELYGNGEYEQATPLLQALFQQRAPYLRILDEHQEETLAALPQAHFETGDYINAVAVARRLLQEPGRERFRSRLEALVLEGYFRLELFEQAAEYAREWCSEQGTYPESALGWTLLAEIAVRDENHEEALWIALQPIAFSGARTMEHLDGAYAAAIHSSLHLDMEEYAFGLFQEMNERGLYWPEEPYAYAESLERLRQLEALFAANDDSDSTNGVEFDQRPANRDLNLPLQHVRKLLLSLPDE